MVKVAIIGFGSRGRMFGRLIKNDPQVQLVAVADTVEASRLMGMDFGVEEAMCAVRGVIWPTAAPPPT